MPGGMPVVIDAAARFGVVPTNGSGTPIPRLTVAASRSGTTAVGTMDTSPTEAEVEALQQTLVFSAADDIKEVDAMLSILPTQTSAVQCVIAVVNGPDAFTDAAALAQWSGAVTPIWPNTPTKIRSSVAITSIRLVAVPSGVTSGVYTGNLLTVLGRAA